MWIGNEATKMRDIRFTSGSLPGRALFAVEGPDAQPFLHNLLTADIAGLKPGEARYAGLLNPQGKILFDMFVFCNGENYLIDCAAAQRAELVKRLGFYKLRANVSVAAHDEDVGVSLEMPDAGVRFADPRTDALGWRFMAKAGDLPGSPDHDAARIALGLADSDADLGSAEFFPHEANLDQLGAVSFAKGCYIGQEVVSRMEHRGTARSRILPVEWAGKAPPRGSEIRSGGKLIGSMLSSSETQGLAVIRLDRLAEAAEPLLTDGVSLSVLKPRWAGYEVPGAKEIA